MASACFLGCRSPNGEEDEAEEKCDNCDIIACSKECMKLHKPTDHPSMLSSEKVVNLVPILDSSTSWIKSSLVKIHPHLI